MSITTRNVTQVRDEKGRLLYDAHGFAGWLGRLLEADRLPVKAFAGKAGLQESVLRSILRGSPGNYGKRGAVKYFEPSARTFAWIAETLGLEIGYVMTKAGFGVDASRWNNFTRLEREWMLAALRRSELQNALGGHGHAPQAAQRMTEELERLAIEDHIIVAEEKAND